jgi:hypothetical protein
VRRVSEDRKQQDVLEADHDRLDSTIVRPERRRDSSTTLRQ